jgi:uncharacterized protein (DUF885 family)
VTRRELLALAAGSSAYSAAVPGIDQFFEEFMQEWVRSDPEAATSLRMLPPDEQDRLDSKLTEISDVALHARVSLAKDGLARLRKFDRAKLTAEQQLSAEIFEYQMQLEVEQERFLPLEFPLNQFTGVQVRFPTLMTNIHPVRKARDAENYVARLEAFGPKLDEALKMMQDRARQGIRLPGFISVETVNQMKRFTAPDPKENILVTSFASRLSSVPGLDAPKRDTLTASAEKIVRESVYPAYRRSLDGLATMNASASNDAGLWRLPQGPEFYAFNLRRFTTTDMTPDQIHQKGLDEVARIEGEMRGLFEKIGYKDGSVEERWVKLQKDTEYPDAPDVRDRVLADYAKIIDENERRSAEAFDIRPRAKCIVKRIPEFQEANAAANYSQPPADGSRPGIFNVPLRGPKFPRAGMRTLAAHEAIPGHHFQIALKTEMTSLPSFRRFGFGGRFAPFTEGWGLYAERLASELGWYKDDAPSDIGRLNGELFRARRLVVDTGLHAKRWTREQSVAYGIQQSEVDRYVVMPGQACSYKIGQMRLLELRELAKKSPRYSLKEYHNVVLKTGGVPLTVLERIVRREFKV